MSQREHLAMVYVSGNKSFCKPICAASTGGPVFKLFLDVKGERCQPCFRLICPECDEAEPLEVWLAIQKRALFGEANERNL